MIIRTRLRNQMKTLIAAAAALSLVGLGCSSEDKVTRGKGAVKTEDKTADEDVKKDVTETEENTEINQLSASLTKVRNKDEVFATMARLTGLAIDDEGLATYFRQQVEGSLPTSSDITSFLGSHQVAIFKLASHMCDLAYQTPSMEIKQGVYANLDYSLPSIELFTSANKEVLVRHLFTRFWGVDGAGMELTDAEDNPLKIMLDLAEVQVANIAEARPTATDADRNRGIAVSLCSTILASGPVTMY